MDMTLIKKYQLAVVLSILPLAIFSFGAITT
jgi:hypothetical protein